MCVRYHVSWCVDSDFWFCWELCPARVARGCSGMLGGVLGSVLEGRCVEWSQV
jgi:hypothetical protein